MRGGENRLHHDRPDPAPLPSIADHQRELAGLVVRLGEIARHRQLLDFAPFDFAHHDKGQFAVVVELGEADQQLLRELLDARHVAVVAAFLRQPAHEGLLHFGIFRPHRPDGDDGAVVQLGAVDAVARVRHHRHVRVASRALGLAHHDPCIERNHAVLVGDQRVDVHFVQLGQLADHFRDAQQHLGQCHHVDRRHVLERAEDFRHPGARNHLPHQVVVQRRQRQAGVVQHLDGDAAHAEGHHRPERFVVGHADHQLAAVARAGHRLDQDAVDDGIRPVQPRTLQDGIEHGPHGRFGAQVQLHAADVGLVDDVQRVDLQYHRIAECLGMSDGLVGVVRQPRLVDRNVERGQHGLRLLLGQHGAAFGQRFLNDPARPVRVGRHLRHVFERPRRLHQQLLVAVEGGQGAEHLDGELRRMEVHDAVLHEQGAAFRHLGIAEPAQEQRLVDFFLQSDHQLGGGKVIGTDLRCQDGQHAVDAGVVQTGLDRRAVAGRAGVTDDVDRIAPRPVDRQHIVQQLDGVLGQRGQFDMIGARAVGGENPRPDAVGHDGQPATLHPVIGRQHPRGGEQLGDGVDPQHAGPLQCDVIDILAGDQMAGMGDAGQRRIVAPRLDDHHRLGTRGHAQRAHEAAGVMQVMDVQQDALGLWVHHQIIENFAEVEVDAVTHRDHAGKADALGVGPVEHCRAQRGRMRHQRQIAAADAPGIVAGVQADDRPHQAEHVRAEHANAVMAGNRHRLLHHFAGQRVGVGELLGQQHRLDAFLATVLHDARPAAHRRGHHGQVDRSLDRAHRADGGHAADHAMVEVDRIQLALEPAGHQVCEYRLPHRTRRFAGPDDGNVFGREQWREVVRLHGDPDRRTCVMGLNSFSGVGLLPG